MSRALRSLVATATMGLTLVGSSFALVGCSGGGGSSIGTTQGTFQTVPVNPSPTPSPGPSPSPFPPPPNTPTGAGGNGGGGGGGGGVTPLKLTSISPSLALLNTPLAGVTLSGAGFTTKAVVTFVQGGVTAATIDGSVTPFAPFSSSSITFTVPAISTTGVYDVVVAESGQTTQKLTGVFTVQAPLAITSAALSGTPGSILTIQGTTFQGVDTVIFSTSLSGSGTPATFTSTVTPLSVNTLTNPNTVTVRIPLGTPTAPTTVTLKSSGTGATSNRATVTINNSTSTEALFQSLTPTHAPLGSPGTCTLVISGAAGLDVTALGYTNFDTYLGGTGVTGTVTGALSITLTPNPSFASQGQNAANYTGLGPAPPASVLPATLTAVTATSATYSFAPPTQNNLAAGALTCDVNIQTVLQGSIPDSFTGALGTGFAYDSNNIPAPSITAINPSSGPQNGGTNVTITGTGFKFAGNSLVTGVRFVSGATSLNLVNLAVASPTTITGTTPQAPLGGVYSVFVDINGGGGTTLTSSPGFPYTYNTGIVITSLSPDSGAFSSPPAVTINGNNFLSISNQIQVAGISFGKNAVQGTIAINDPNAAINIISPTQLQIKHGSVPASSGGNGPVDVTITGATITTGSTSFTVANATAINGFYYGGALQNPAASLLGNASTGATGARAIAVNANFTAVVSNASKQLAVFKTDAVRSGNASPEIFQNSTTTNGVVVGAGDLVAPVDVRFGSFGSGGTGQDIAVLSANGGTPTVTIFTYQSGTAPTAVYTVATFSLSALASTTSISFDVGDVNGDGFDDIVAADNNDTVETLLNNGRGNFSTSVTTSTTITGGINLTPQHVKIAGGKGKVQCGCSCNDKIPSDMNRDNVADIVITKDSTTVGTAAQLSVWLGNSSGAFATLANGSATNLDPQNTTVTSIALGDIDKNGTSDVVVACVGGTGSITVLNGLGNGGTSIYEIYNPPGVNPLSILLGDVNFDCQLDLVVGEFNNDQVAVLLGNGDGTFAQQVNYPAEVQSLSGVGSDPALTSNIVSIASVDVGNGIEGVFCVDQQVGAAVGQGIVTHVPRTLINAYFGFPQSSGSGNTFLSATSGTDPSAIAFGDVDADGHMDFVVCDRRNGTVSVFLGDGKENFVLKQTFTTGNAPESLCMVPLHSLAAGAQSGRLDLVVACAGDDGIYVYTNHLDGTFAPGGTFYSTNIGSSRGTTPVQVISSEIDGDGLCDVITVNQVSNNVTIFIGDGMGNLTATNLVTVGFAPLGVAAGALAGNASRQTKLDLATCNSTTGDVSVLLNNTSKPVSQGGTVSFSSLTHWALGGSIAQPPPQPGSNPQPPVTRDPLGIQPKSIAIGDVNLDGANDIVTADAGTGTITILHGKMSYPVTVTGVTAAFPAGRRLIGPTIGLTVPTGGQTTLVSIGAVFPEASYNGVPGTYSGTINATTASSGTVTVTVDNVIGGGVLCGAESNINPVPAFSGVAAFYENDQVHAVVDGTVFLTNGSATVTGVGTKFLSQLAAGQTVEFLSQAGTFYTVLNVATDTNLTLTSSYSGNAGTTVSIPSLASVASGFVVGAGGFAKPTGAFFVPSDYYAIAGSLSAVGNPPVILPTGGIPGSVRVFDMNGDLYPDIVVGDSSAGIVTFIGQGLAGRVYGLGNGVVTPNIFTNGLIQTWSNNPNYCVLAEYLEQGSSTPSFEGGSLYTVCPAGEFFVTAPGPLNNPPFPSGTGYPIGLFPQSAQLTGKIVRTVGMPSQVVNIDVAHTTDDCPPTVGAVTADGNVRLFKSD